MKPLLLLLLCTGVLTARGQRIPIFDVHLHGTARPAEQLGELKQAGVYKAAISSSWDLQNSYRSLPGVQLLYGLMFPCPKGKVPYSGQLCYSPGEDWPPLPWVEAQIREGKIQFFGEVLSQYYGISPSDTSLYPYYRLAQQYNLPVGIHTGGAGPDHGSPDFKTEMGHPDLLEGMLSRFPDLAVWIMHGGVAQYAETIRIMQTHQRVYCDISVLCNPDIVPPAVFSQAMQAFMEAGLEDRLMFGTDNGAIEKAVGAVEALPFLSLQQKEGLYYRNAERFFQRAR